jgi:hypothetical protein
MPDMRSELRRINEDTAAQARALPVAEVIRRGNGRRSRTIAGVVAACSAVTIGVAVVLTGVAQGVRPPSQPVGATAGSTLTATAAGPDGRMTIWVRYVPAAGSQVTVEAVRASFAYRPGYANPFFQFVFRSQTTGKVDQSLASPHDWRNDATSLTTGWLTLSDAAGSRTFADGEVLIAALRVESVGDSPGKLFTVNQVGAVLSAPLRLAGKVSS